MSIPVATSERPGQIAPLMLGAIGFLYFAQPVILPILLAGVAGIAVKPLIRWAFWCRLPAPVSAAIVLCVLVSALGVACFQMGRPAVTWLNEAPQHMTELRHRVQKLFPRLARFSKAAAVVNNFGATEDEQKQSPTVTLKTSRVPSSFNNWTGTSLAGGIEPLVLLYLLRASGDLFLQRQMRVMPTLQDKLSAVAIGREIQEYISKCLFSVSRISLGVGVVVCVGLYFLGVPNPAMWGIPGVILSVPILVSIKAFADRVPDMAPVSELLSR